MSEIHLTQQLESDTLKLPELKPLIGRKVEIIVREVAGQATNHPWDGLESLAGKDLVDPDAYQRLREFDRSQESLDPR
jgi:hypothetical protein